MIARIARRRRPRSGERFRACAEALPRAPDSARQRPEARRARPFLPSAGCRRRCSGSGATCGWATTRRCSPRATRRAPTATVLPVFVFDDRLWRPVRRSAPPLPARLPRRRCDEQTGGALVLRSGDPARGDPGAGARGRRDARVHISRRRRALRPAAGHRRRARAGRRPAGPHRLALRRSPRAGSPSATGRRSRSSRPSPAPGASTAGAPRPLRPATSRWLHRRPLRRPAAGPDRADVDLPPAGEAAALAAWARFRDERLPGYAEGRNLPGTDGTSRMSAYLKYGCIHPRTLLADLAGDAGGVGPPLHRRAGLAGVLRRRPLAPARLGARVPQARAAGRWATTAARTPTALVRRLGAPAAPASRSSTPACASCSARRYVHNRVRMIVASFLVKDLHQEWTRGARYFLQHLVDGDLASNNHGWQWVAGHRHRRLALLPRLQPGHPGQEVRPGRRLREALGARAARPRPEARARTVDGARRHPGRLSRARSSTTRTSARSRWTATTASAPADQSRRRTGAVRSRVRPAAASAASARPHAVSPATSIPCGGASA